MAASDPDEAARALVWIHENWRDLPAMGERGRSLASAYSAEQWARCLGGILDGLDLPAAAHRRPGPVAAATTLGEDRVG